MCWKTSFIIITLSISFACSARILGIVPTPSYSHQIVFKNLWKELSLRGHEVTVLTTDPANDPSLTNLTEVNLSFSYKILRDELLNLITTNEKNFLSYIKGHFETFDKIIDAELSHPEVKKIFEDKNAHFDLLIVEAIHPTMYAFSRRFNCPYIAVSSMGVEQTTYSKLGCPTHPILYPELLVTLAKNPTIMQKIEVIFWNEIYSMAATLYQKPGINRLIEKHFGKEYLPAENIIDEMSLLFINTDPIFHHIRPLVPSVIQIGGGATIGQSKPLPKDLKKLLDEAKNGFIYFSLGSNANSKDLPPETQKTILDTFSELPYTVVWKYENSNLANKPDNVFISKWMPQQDILGHPNIKLFITHGGAQSIDETIHFKVPIIGMPVFADQPANILRMVNLGVGLQANPQELKKEDFKAKILEVINNPKYKNKLTQLSNLLKDQPMTGLQKAIWWVEYVIRNKGAKHLRSPAMDLPSYQYYLVDVIGFCILIFAIAAAFSYFLIKKIFRLAICLIGKNNCNVPKIKKQ